MHPFKTLLVGLVGRFPVIKNMTRFLAAEEGVTSIEYAFIAFTMATAVIFSLGTVATELNGMFKVITDAFKSVL